MSSIKKINPTPPDIGHAGIRNFLHGLTRKQKRLILVINDAMVFVTSLFISFVLRLGIPDVAFIQMLIPLSAIVAAGGIFALGYLGFYRTLIRAFEFRTVNILAAGIVIAGLIIAAYDYFDPSLSIPRSIPIIFVMVSFILIGTSRVVARWYYQYSIGIEGAKEKVIIYGAGENGNHLAATLSGSREFSLVGFLDDDPAIKGHFMRGRRIFSPDELELLVSRYKKLRIMLCISNLSPVQKRRIFENVRKYNIQLDVVPSLADVVSGISSYEDFQQVQIEDLLGRETVPPIDEYFVDAIAGKTILVSGAGGSIGSEICRQILSGNPARLIVIENSEPALYLLNRNLDELIAHEHYTTPIDYCLCNNTDRVSVSALMGEKKPNIVYHAAAYKHVPIVENNILAAVHNNIIGTQVMAEESIAAGVGRFVLISTDKAVRPPNVMGATKRVAELILQAHAQEQEQEQNGKKPKTIFSIVRFGNVLGSSGSVIPLFISQIDAGGPVTVTHEEITRYFMTISEAAQLVIQAGFLSCGGDVYVLEMGKPVKIVELAKLMVQLSGKTIISDENPHGDIELQISGLRPGEKLFEELLIDSDAKQTAHPKILVANEVAISPKKMELHLKAFSKAIANNNRNAAITRLGKLVSGFNPSVKNSQKT